MTLQSELKHLSELSRVDALIERVRGWSGSPSVWQAGEDARSLLSGLMSRVRDLRLRLESPLVVATFGGTGTGKSSLVNALVGGELTAAGRQRPTTTQPVLLIHEELQSEALGFDTDGFLIRRSSAETLRNFVLIDCPDPDTSEDGSIPDSNLAILRSVVPHCDVLLFASTQQKYRSARVIDELSDVSTGCRLVFVQTHADRDDDIREDWRRVLSGDYSIPDMYFVDSVRALKEQQEGRLPSGEFARLRNMLLSQLGTAHRVTVRRSNLVDLLLEALRICEAGCTERQPAVDELRNALGEQRLRLREELAGHLSGELMVNRHLWERRLLGAITDAWGFSPFSSLLRLSSGLGALIASFTFFRARTTAQMAIVGAIQGSRWLRSRAAESEADESLTRVSTTIVSDSKLQEARVAVSGYVRAAGITVEGRHTDRDLSRMRKQAAGVEQEFLADVGREVDGLIERLARQHTCWWTRWRYELLFVGFVALLLGRIGYNFFWSSFLAPIVGAAEQREPLLSTDFYIPAVLFLVIWSVLLVTAYSWRLRRSLSRSVRDLAERISGARLRSGLFPKLQEACEAADEDCRELHSLREQTESLRSRIAVPDAQLAGRS